METLVLNGKQYVKASKAARDLGYTSDYVGQLCRGGHVDAHLVGRTWYVNPDTLTKHQVEKKRNSRVKAREYAKKAIEESRSLKINAAKNSLKNVAIHYDGDRNTLIPEVRKVTIERDTVVPPVLIEEVDVAPSYSIENENKKIILSGVLKVEDAEIAPMQSDTVFMRPTFKRGTGKPTQMVGTGKSQVMSEEEPIETSHLAVQRSFTERIQDYQDNSEDIVPLIDNNFSSDSRQGTTTQTSAVGYFLFLILLAMAACLSVFVEKEMVTTSQSTTVTYNMNFDKSVFKGF